MQGAAEHFGAGEITEDIIRIRNPDVVHWMSKNKRPVVCRKPSIHVVYQTLNVPVIYAKYGSPHPTSH